MIHDVKNDPEHKKESIDPFIPIDIKCPEHPKDRMNLFCLNEKGKLSPVTTEQIEKYLVDNNINIDAIGTSDADIQAWLHTLECR